MKFNGAGLAVTSVLFTIVASAATLTTDKEDYQVGEEVVISGAGWQPGEQVQLDLAEDPPRCPANHGWAVTADANGNFTDSSFQVDDIHYGVTFTLRATGQSSGFTAERVFTDSHTVTSVVPNTGPTSGGTAVDINGSGFANAGVPYTARFGTNSVPATRQNNNRLTAVTPPGPAGAVNVTVTAADGHSFTLTNGYTYCVGPAITNQPSSQAACEGSSATFSVGASGPGLSFRWRRGTTNLSNGGNISGATSETLTINPVAATNAGNYSVVVSNSCSVVTSAVATLTVGIGATPLASRTNCPGTTASFSTTASGVGPFTFTWRRGGTNLSNGGNIAIVTSSNASTVTINPVACSDAGIYCVEAAGACGTVTNCATLFGDTTPPILSKTRNNEHVQCLADVEAPEEVTATDNCDTNVVVTFTAVTNGACPIIIERRWVGTDDCGNSATNEQMVTINDTQKPRFVGVPANTNYQCLADVPPPATVTATDNCDTNVIVSVSGTTNGTCPTLVVYTWTATDACTNVATVSQTNTVLDTELPRSCVTPPPNMVSWWPAEGNAQDIQDGNDGQLESGATALASGKAGQAFSFDGIDDRVRVSDSANLDITTALTIDAWIFVAADAPTNDTYGIVSKYRSLSDGFRAYELFVQEQKLVLRATAQGDAAHLTVVSSNNINFGEWVHVGATLDASQANLYINGQLDASAPGLNPIQVNDLDLFIGAREAATTPFFFFKGFIDEVELFNRALTSNEIRSIYLADSFGKCKPMVTNTDPGRCDAVVNYSPNFTDNCTGTVVNCSPPPGSIFPRGTTDVTCTISDGCNAITNSFPVTVNDNEPPEITCGTNRTVECGTAWDFDEPTATDNCDGNNLTVHIVGTETNSLCGNTFTATRTWETSDSSRNTNICSQTVTVVDTTPPTITCPPGVVVNSLDNVPPCSQSIAEFETQGGTATDACDTNLTFRCLDLFQPGLCESTITRTYTVTDICTNASICTQVIRVIPPDRTPPQIVCPTNLVFSTDPGQCSKSNVTYTATATDNCDTNVTVECTPPSGSTFPKGTNTVSCMATDDTGNVAGCGFTVTVIDTEPPQITCPTNVVLDCTQMAHPDFTNGQFCTYGQGGWGQRPSGNNVGTLLSNNFAAVYPGGSVEVGIPGPSGFSLTFTSASRIEAYLPAGGMPGALTADGTNVTSSSAGNFGGQVLALQLNVDFSDAGVTQGPGGPFGDLIFNDQSSPLYGKSVREILAIANRALGGGDVSSNGVTIKDDLNVLAGNLNMSFDLCQPSPWAQMNLIPPNGSMPCFCGSGCSKATDNCDTNVLIECSDILLPPSCSGGRVIARTWTATDSSGNSNSCTQIITVADNTPPTITCPTNLTVQCFSNVPPCPGSLAQFIAQGGIASDNCDTNLTYTCSDDPLSEVCGAIRRTHTVTDDCTNSASCVQIITVRDTIPPTITCPPNIAVQCASDVPLCSTNLEQFRARGGTASDNCDDQLTYSCSDGPLVDGTCGGTIRRTHTVTDNCSNTASCVQIITVRDTIRPTITCPTNLTVQCLSNVPTCSLTAFLAQGGTAGDNCDANLEYRCSDSELSGGRISRTHTVTDDCTNTASCVQIITVQGCGQTNVVCVDGADGDPNCGHSEPTHALWLPGIGTDFDFIPELGRFTENPDGTATITGTVRSRSNNNKGFVVTFNLSGLTTNPPPDSPKKELDEDSYVDEGGPIDPATWRYYTGMTGTLTGTGSYAGALITITRVGPAFQVGSGASGKNLKFGASAWFLWEVVQQPSSGSCQRTGQGDINVDLFDCPPPASARPCFLHWAFDEPSGNTALDSSGSGNHGVLLNGPVRTNGIVGRALRFDGSNDRVSATNPTSLNITGAFTVAAWVKPESCSGSRYILIKGSSSKSAYALRISDSKLQYRWISPSGVESKFQTASGALTVGRWTHVAAAHTPGSAPRLFINGAAVSGSLSSGSATALVGSSPYAFTVGSTSDGSDRFQGLIDHVFVCPGAYTAAQIQGLTNGMPSGPPASPPALFITTSSPLLTGRVSTPYSQTLIATGGAPAYLWSLASGVLPAGLSLNTNSGAISGTPTAAVTNTFRARVRDTTGQTNEKNFTLAITNSPTTVSNPPPIVTNTASGCLVNYKFDEPSGVAALDSSGKGNHGVLLNGPIRTNGMVGGALRFDGVNDRVAATNPASLNVTSAFTVGAWVRPESVSGSRYIVIKGNQSSSAYGYALRASDAKIQYRWVSPSGVESKFQTTSNVLAVGRWTHLAAAHTPGSSPQLFINGVAVPGSLSAGSATALIRPSANPFTVGCSSDGSDRFQGLIDEVFVCNGALTAGEVRNQMTGESEELMPMPPPPPLAAATTYFAELTIIDLQVVGTTAAVTWATEPGRIYRVQYKNSLDEMDWRDLDADIVAEGTVATIQDSLDRQPQRFYRVLLRP